MSSSCSRLNTGRGPSRPGRPVRGRYESSSEAALLLSAGLRERVRMRRTPVRAICRDGHGVGAACHKIAVAGACQQAHAVCRACKHTLWACKHMLCACLQAHAVCRAPWEQPGPGGALEEQPMVLPRKGLGPLSPSSLGRHQRCWPKAVLASQKP